MKRERKWTRRVVRGLGITAMVVLVLWFGLVPAIIDRVIAAQFEGLGLPEAGFRIGGYSLSHLEINHLSVGRNDRLRIGSVGIDYSAWQLLSGRIDSIEIVGLALQIGRKGGLWDLGPLADLHGEASAEAPFRRMTLRSSTLTLDLEGRRLQIPISGSVENTDPNTLSLDLTANVEGATLHFTGTVDPRSQDFTLVLVGDAPDLGRVLTVLAPSTAAAARQQSGGMTARVVLARERGGLRMNATAQGPGWRLAPVAVRETGLEDWLRGKTDVARLQFHGEAGVDTPWLFVQQTLLDAGIDVRAIGRCEFLVDGNLELLRPRTDTGDSWTWSAAVPTLRATLASGDMVIPAVGGGIKGVSATIQMTAVADAKGLRVGLLGDSWVAIASAEIPAGERTVAVNSAKFVMKQRDNQPLLTVTVDGGRAVTSAGALVAEAAAPMTVLAGEGTTAKLTAVRSVLEGTWGDEGGTLAGSLRISGIGGNLLHKFGAHVLSAGVSDASLLVTARREFPAGHGPAPSRPIEFVVSTPPGAPGVGMTVAGVDAATGATEVRGTVAFADGTPPAVSLRVSLTGASVAHKGLALAMTGLDADIPLTWNVGVAPQPGHVAVKSVELRGVALPSLSGTLTVVDTRADFAVAWEPLPGAKLRAEGSAAIGARGPSIRAYLSLPLFEMADEEAIGRLVPSLKGLLATGSFALDGYVRLSAEGLSPNVALTVLDGRFKSKAWQADAEGVFATVRINSVTPLLTPRKEYQVALVRRLTIGKLDVRDGFVAFRVEPRETDGHPTGWTAYVQRGECGWVGGRLFIEDFRFDPEAKEHTVTVFARDLKLGALLTLLPSQKITGVGSLDGKLPVTIGRWPDIRFGEGLLRTAPGQSGWFKVKDTEVLGTVLDSTDPRFKSDSLYVEIKKRLVNAFKDFEYDELSVVFTKDADGKFVARVNTRGRARTGEAQEFESVTINFRDFDKVLRDVILIGRGVGALK